MLRKHLTIEKEKAAREAKEAAVIDAIIAGFRYGYSGSYGY